MNFILCAMPIMVMIFTLSISVHFISTTGKLLALRIDWPTR